MKACQAVLLLLLALGCVHVGESFKPNLPPLKDAQVLVIGASGQVGEKVCLKLSQEGYRVRAMVRDVNNFFPRKKDLGEGPIEVVLGDVLDKRSLLAGMQDCQSCIDCHGASRLAIPRDIIVHPRNDPLKTHPYHVNYLGVKNIVEAAEEMGVKRLVRISGISVGLPAFHPFTYLLNLLASMAIKWQLEAEKVIREAQARGLEYTVVRPGSLTDKPRPQKASLLLSSNGKPTSILKSWPMYTVSRKEVADLMVGALQSDNTVGSTISCSWGWGANGPKKWNKLLAKVKPDTGRLPSPFYKPAMAVWGVTTLVFISSTLLTINKFTTTLTEGARRAKYRRN